MSKHCILVADEDVDTRIILRTLLERHGYDVAEAGSGAAAVEAVGAAPGSFSLVILNYPMIVSEQVTLAAWLRKQPATSVVPIINLTSRAVPLLIEEASRVGVTITIAKPLDVQRILDLVHELTNPMVAH